MVHPPPSPPPPLQKQPIYPRLNLQHPQYPRVNMDNLPSGPYTNYDPNCPGTYTATNTTPVPLHPSRTSQSYTYSMVFRVPDQPWPSLALLTQCLDKVRRRDCRVFSSLEAIQQHGGAHTGDLILTFTVAEPIDAVIFVSAEGAISLQIRNWNVDRSMPGWCLVSGP
ncbi:uncharacterized protein ACLA_094110 [Aspergillus clavatus NRRL 1]|uniref:Uncharacterized protein n=1 Tax=Aspergillus clavatus (strain ATCC 1007 / CBS 513.65 / DSM 816 / NCTC 3887 / NRRL 1 / QM 1276 / 107) TaxID=344612 RepID=A1CFR3_ASPCL|nr:uncharacterized protein ACLA_094110 [Aspergillus clavatus NRRL 1]EAW11712.1 hypothetical protein ACLA_094110 [Aspergillus clavatus NRRL 1]